jgi:hypothetical protein
MEIGKAVTLVIERIGFARTLRCLPVGIRTTQLVRILLRGTLRDAWARVALFGKLLKRMDGPRFGRFVARELASVGLPYEFQEVFTRVQPGVDEAQERRPPPVGRKAGRELNSRNAAPSFR